MGTIRRLVGAATLCTAVLAAAQERLCNIPASAYSAAPAPMPLDFHKHAYSVKGRKYLLGSVEGEVGGGRFEGDIDFVIMSRHVKGKYGSEVSGAYEGRRVNGDDIRVTLDGYFNGSQAWICRTVFVEGTKTEEKPLLEITITDILEVKSRPGTYEAIFVIKEPSIAYEREVRVKLIEKR